MGRNGGTAHPGMSTAWADTHGGCPQEHRRARAHAPGRVPHALERWRVR